ncbi:MAG: ThuA domain-containing protein [Planctomycetaceae bacterium]
MKTHSDGTNNVLKRTGRMLLAFSVFAVSAGFVNTARSEDTLSLIAPDGRSNGKHIVLVAGDEEYRSEESMPMLGKILSQRFGFRCTVVFSLGPDGADYIDANNQKGLRGLAALQSADLMIIATRFRQPDEQQAKYIADFLNAGKPVIGLRTATHAFRGSQKFGSTLSFDEFGLKILGEQWVSHHGRHKVEGARGVIEPKHKDHPILNGVTDVFAPSDVYGVVHLKQDDQILMRGAVTKSLDPKSEILKDDKRNAPMQPFAWLHKYTSPEGTKQGTSFCTTGGASVDLLNEDLRRMVINAALYLTGFEVPEMADVSFVDDFHPSFFGFINDPSYWKTLGLKPENYALGRSPRNPDPPGTPNWPHRPAPPKPLQ